MATPPVEQALVDSLPSAYRKQLTAVYTVDKSRHPAAFIVLQDRQSLFVKQLSAHSVEADVLARLNRYRRGSCLSNRLLPQLLYADSTLLITSKIAGRHFGKSELLNHLPAFARCLHLIHKADIELAGIPLLALPSMQTLTFPLSETAQQRLARAVAEITAGQGYTGLLHGDLTRYNLFQLLPEAGAQTDAGFAFIDWEFAQVGDCRWDLATLAVEFKLARAEFRDLCAAYQSASGIADPRFFEIAEAWAWVYAIVSLDWAYQNKQPYGRYLSYIKANEALLSRTASA
ncbi:phosphotransferase family protein [Motiliproteus sp. SC1-56]|uniref:phosphotransferase family protein n=1 Tax=Motiliproteus sp. SC1-56 TaxID=2799565 RepID=UPI001A8CAB33|nr:phosphotransferase [Motiliproteus sp. SC1-56]